MGSKFMQFLTQRADKPIYVISRIKMIVNEIITVAERCNLKLNIVNVPMTEFSDIIHPSYVPKVIRADIVIIDPKILALNYKIMPSLKWAYSTWAGVEPLFELIEEKPPFVITRHGGLDFCNMMAEYVMAQVLNSEYNFKGLWEAEKEKSWARMLQNYNPGTRKRPLKELVVGVLGVGNMGRAVAKLFKLHGTLLIGLSRTPRNQNQFGDFEDIVTVLEHLLSASDVIVNTLPSTKETIGLLNGQVLKACVKKPIFINVGRASIIDEEDLLNALANEWLSGAVLDVFKEEPLSADSLLWGRVTVTPHIAAISQPLNIAKDFLIMLEAYANNRPLQNVVNWEAGY